MSCYQLLAIVRMIKNPLFHLSNFEMAVSYGATFPVLVLLLFIGFTGYLEVKKHFTSH